MHQAAARAHGLDADAGVGAVEREVEDAELADAAVGLRADGHAVAPVEVVVADGHVGELAGTAALDGDVVVALAEVAVGDGDVLRAAAGIDAVGVAGERMRRMAMRWTVSILTPQTVKPSPAL